MYAREQTIIATPIGTIRLVAAGGALESVTIERDRTVSRGTSTLLQAASRQIDQWFAGERQLFDLPLVPIASPRGAVLRAGIMAISFGNMLSYGALARSLNSSPRAIGQACARNPLPIIVPCHRVLAAGGILGAYSGGEGPATKAWLLAHEQRYGAVDAERLI